MSNVKTLVKRSVCGAFLGIFALFATVGAISSARATTYVSLASEVTGADWTVTVGTGISLVGSFLYTGSTNPAGPTDQGYNAGSGHLLDWIQNTAGFTDAGLVTDGQVTSMSFTGTDADLFGVHFGCGKSKDCELVWLFSGDTTFTVNSLKGFSNISAFSDTTATPLPAALPLFASGIGALGLLGWRRKRKGSGFLFS